jgi:methyl-accepting chemotaxis protein
MDTSKQIANTSILQSRIAGERIIAITRLILLVPLVVFAIILYVQEAVVVGFGKAISEPAYITEFSCIIAVTIYSLWLLNQLKSNKYHNSISYISPAIDITLLNFIVFFNAGVPREGLVITGAPTFLYFIFLALSILRNSPSSVIFTGIYITISYVLLSFHALSSLSIFADHGKVFTNQFAKFIQVDSDDEVFKPLIFLIATGLFAYVARRFNTMVTNQIKTSLDREHLRETFIENVKQVAGNLYSSGKALSSTYAGFLARIEEMVASSRKIEEETNAEHGVVEATSKTISGIIQSIGDVAKNIQNQAFLIDETVSAIEEMSGSIKMITNTSQKATIIAKDLLNAAQDGGETVSNVNQAIIETEKESKKIEEIVDLISGIAGTTNLLSMNAAIEAAHAGDAGKGFAVIAEEIGKLAETSGSNANQIAEILKDISERIRNIAGLALNANSKLDAIVSDAEQTTEINSTIRTAMEEELNTINEMTQSLHSLNSITEQVKGASLEQSAGGSGLINSVTMLKTQADNVLALIRNQLEELNKINGLSQDLNTAVKENETIVEQLEGLLKKI